MQRIQEALEREGLDFFLTEDLFSIRFFTGLCVSKGTLLLGKQESRFFVDTRYLSRAKKESAVPAELFSWEKIDTFIGEKKKIGYDTRKMTVFSFSEWQKKIRGEFLFSPFFERARLIKNGQERKKMKEAASLNYKGYLHILQKIKTGVKEEEISWEFEKFCRENGGEKVAFEPIVAFGENSASPHWKSSSKKLKEGEVILLDLGVVKEGYASDFTRVHFYKEASKTMKEFYDLVKKAKDKALQKVKPGVKIQELDSCVRDVFQKEGKEELFLHSLGHGIGLEVHEFPKVSVFSQDKDLLLEEGMFITIEPGLYKEKEGGVRLEDTVMVTEKGFLNLYPEEKEALLREKC